MTYNKIFSVEATMKRHHQENKFEFTSLKRMMRTLLKQTRKKNVQEETQESVQFLKKNRVVVILKKTLAVIKELCELLIDFESMKENDFDLTADVEFQGWNIYFDRLLGPVFLKLVKELWIHGSSSNHQATSYVMGKKIAITEELIAKLIGYNGGGIRCSEMAEKCLDLTTISREIFTSGQPSGKIKDLKDYFRIWAKIILGCINHRKLTSSPNYINIDQQFLLYFIATKNLKKMKIIDNIKKDPTISTKEVIISRTIPLKYFPLFSQMDATPEIIVRYLEACKMDGTNTELNIRDLRQQAPDVVLKKS
ncbi:hypothetical protein RYX36_014928 [Vicia faba]